MTVRVGSLCFGVGGLDLGLARADRSAELCWYAEKDDDAATVAGKHFPGVPNVGDVTAVRWGTLAPVDLLTAGFPCQPVSAAGQRRADRDDRWLWPYVYKAVRRLRPERVFLENVQNLTAVQSGTILAGILADLRRAGYAIRWTVLGACLIGAPHHRHRWWLVADRCIGPAPEAVRIGTRGFCGATRAGGRALMPTPCTADGSGGPGSLGRDGGHNLRTAVTLLPTPVARDGDHRGEGDADYWRRRVIGGRVNGMPLGAAVGLLPTPRASDGERGRGNCGQTFTGGGMTLGAAAALLPTPRATDIGTEGRRAGEGRRPQLGQAIREGWDRFADAVTLWEDLTGIPAPAPTEPAPKGGRRLNPVLSEWMMGLPAGWVTDLMPRGPALRLIGNAVVPEAATAAYSILTGESGVL
jgi:DNA (cytosine-5)-methyltransferase 1